MGQKKSPVLSGPVTHGSLVALLNNYRRSNDKISYMLKKGDLVPIKRGLYFFKKNYEDEGLSLFHVANILYGPSYVSLYSALSYHGLIPERVNLIESVTAKRSKSISTPIGGFRYISSVPEIFHIGINYEQTNSRTAFLIASPTKAICDIIWHTRRLNIKNKLEMEDFLGKDIRFDLDRLNELGLDELEKYIKKTNRKRKQLNHLKDLVETHVLPSS